MDAKQRESTEAGEQPQMDADLRRLGTANGHEVTRIFSGPQLLGSGSRMPKEYTHPTGGEVSGGRRFEQRGSGLSDSWVGAIELLFGETKAAE
jgi:hypothetical protein